MAAQSLGGNWVTRASPSPHERRACTTGSAHGGFTSLALWCGGQGVNVNSRRLSARSRGSCRCPGPAQSRRSSPRCCRTGGCSARPGRGGCTAGSRAGRVLSEPKLPCTHGCSRPTPRPTRDTCSQGGAGAREAGRGQLAPLSDPISEWGRSPALLIASERLASPDHRPAGDVETCQSPLQWEGLPSPGSHPGPLEASGVRSERSQARRKRGFVWGRWCGGTPLLGVGGPQCLLLVVPGGP